LADHLGFLAARRLRWLAHLSEKNSKEDGMTSKRRLIKGAPLLVLCLGLLLVGSAPAADSLNVRLIGELDLPSYECGVAVVGDLAYVADFDSGLRVISIADPVRPVEIGYCDTPGQAYQVAVADRFAYVADYSAGLRIISVADPADPADAGHCDTPGHAYGVAVDGDFTYVGDRDSGLRVISVADPAHPVEVGHCDTPDQAYQVAVLMALHTWRT